MYIGYIGGVRVDYMGYPSKGGILPDDINLALSSMRKAKTRCNRHPNSRWNDNDYIEKIIENKQGNKVKTTIKMKDVWQGRL